MLEPDKTALVVVDVQGKLAHLMHEKESLFSNLQKMICGAQILGLPILWCEQNPKGLGPTIPEIARLMEPLKPITKISFSCCGESTFMDALKQNGRTQVLLAGIEAHICVYLTACDLANAGYEVQVVSDAVSSRSLANKEIALRKIERLPGGGLTCTETALFELLRVAEGEKFKAMIKLLK